MSTTALQAAPKRKVKLDVTGIVSTVSLVVLTVLMLLPVFFMVTTALKSQKEMLQFPPTLLPASWQWSNFAEIFDAISFGTLYKNSLIIAVLSVLGTVLSSSVAAFGFARYRAKGKDFLFLLMLSTMMLPYPAIMIPQFIIFSNIGWMDSYLPIVVPAFFGSAYNIFLLKQFFTTLPDELFDAGRIDGCNEFRMYWNIALPLSSAALATVAIFAFIYSWNDLLTPVLYLSSDDMFTLPVGMASLTSSKFRITPWNWLMAASVLAVLPIVALFAVAQKRFVEGIVLTGIK